MGTDIHAHFEIKVNNKWIYYSQPNIERNYELFEKMAGVRGKLENAIVLPKGLPDDISETTAFHKNIYESDWHTYSWLNKHEIKSIIEFHANISECKDSWRIHKEWGYFCGIPWVNFDEFNEGSQKKIQDIRLVFWFDN